MSTVGIVYAGVGRAAVAGFLGESAWAWWTQKKGTEEDGAERSKHGFFLVIRRVP